MYRDRNRRILTDRENVEGDLASNGKLEIEIGELLLENLDHGLADLGRLVIEVEFFALLLVAVTTNRRHVNEARAELNKSTATEIDTDERLASNERVVHVGRTA